MSTLGVETEALVRHGNGRYSDALICQAIGGYLSRVGAIPDTVWGDFPWAPAWRQQWREAVADRIKEAGYAHERLQDAGQTLIQAAADYAHSDVRVAADFSAISTSPLMAYVNALEHPRSVTAHPGGSLRLDGGPVDGKARVPVPDDTPEGHALNQAAHDGSLNATEMWPGDTDLSKTPTGILRAEMASEGRTKLWEFLGKWSGQLAQAEKIVNMWGVAPRKSCLEMLDQAKGAWPAAIANHANLLKVGSNAFRALKTNMAAQVKDLQQYWASPGASGAYVIYAESLGEYYEAIAGNLQWLGEEGEKAAHTIDSLQLDYANIGYEHMGIIADQLQAYLDAAESVSHSVDGPLNALTAALSSLAGSLISSWKADFTADQGTLTISRDVIDNAPQFNDISHDVAQPPESPSGAWRSGNWSTAS